MALNESWDPDVRDDMEMMLNKIVPEGLAYRHSCEGPDDMVSKPINVFIWDETFHLRIHFILVIVWIETKEIIKWARQNSRTLLKYNLNWLRNMKEDLLCTIFLHFKEVIGILLCT